jgi:hypothetical protein
MITSRLRDEIPDIKLDTNPCDLDGLVVYTAKASKSYVILFMIDGTSIIYGVLNNRGIIFESTEYDVANPICDFEKYIDKCVDKIKKAMKV